MNQHDRANQIVPPPYSNRHIIDIAESIGEETIRCIARPPHDFPPELFQMSFDVAFNEVIYPKYNIDFVDDEDLGTDSDGNEILGHYDPKENRAFVNVRLRNDPRWTFTCWHEVGGHGVLQGGWLRREFARVHRQHGIETTEASLSFATTDILERQANIFAAHAAAPTGFLRFALRDFFCITRPIRYIGRGEYTLDYRGCCRRLRVESFMHLCRILAEGIQWRFDFLSLEALAYRIGRLHEIVQNVTDRGPGLRRTGKALVPLEQMASTPFAMAAH